MMVPRRPEPTKCNPKVLYGGYLLLYALLAAQIAAFLFLVTSDEELSALRRRDTKSKEAKFFIGAAFLFVFVNVLVAISHLWSAYRYHKSNGGVGNDMGPECFAFVLGIYLIFGLLYDSMLGEETSSVNCIEISGPNAKMQWPLAGKPTTPEQATSQPLVVDIGVGSSMTNCTNVLAKSGRSEVEWSVRIRLFLWTHFIILVLAHTTVIISHVWAAWTYEKPVFGRLGIGVRNAYNRVVGAILNGASNADASERDTTTFSGWMRLLEERESVAETESTYAGSET